jgi:hypothetical protein
MQRNYLLQVDSSRNHYSTSNGIMLPTLFKQTISPRTTGHRTAMSGNGTKPFFWEESVHSHLNHTVHSVLQAVTLQFPVVKSKYPWHIECTLLCWTELLVERNFILKVILFCDGIHMAVCLLNDPVCSHKNSGYLDKFGSLTINIFVVWY